MKGSDLKIVFLGPKYTFSHEAALTMFPKGEYFYALSPKQIFKQVESGEMDYGILPVENSATGLIPEFFPLLLDQDFQMFSDEIKVHVVKELYLPIYHHLLASTGIPLGEIRRLYTHRQPYLQSVDWVSENLREVSIEFTESTAAAAEKLAQDSKGACIGGNLLARQQKLTKVRENIHDYAKNITRFFAISAKHVRIQRTSNKTTFSVIVPDQVGTLVRVLQLVASNNINLLNIKTLPVRAAHVFRQDFKDWFVVDVAASRNSEEFQSLLNSFRDHTELVLSYKVLGSYVSRPGDDTLRKVTRTRAPGRGPQDLQAFYGELINKGESDRVEFKSSLRYDFRTKGVNKELPKAVAKTICGFLNTKGGYLFIGVSDTGEVLGLQYDIEVVSRKTLDSFLTVFYQLISDAIGKEYSQHVHADIVDFKDKKVCCLKIDESSKAAWFCDGSNYILFIRVGNATRPLNAKEANDYIMSRFNVK